jgi:hypothetical protein
MHMNTNGFIISTKGVGWGGVGVGGGNAGSDHCIRVRPLLNIIFKFFFLVLMKMLDQIRVTVE